MFYSKGFSLLEVLISLLLSSSVALVLLEQQWQSTRFFQILEEKNQTHQLWKNQQELKLSGLS